jgi:hypothetical protein
MCVLENNTRIQLNSFEGVKFLWEGWCRIEHTRDLILISFLGVIYINTSVNVKCSILVVFFLFVANLP